MGVFFLNQLTQLNRSYRRSLCILTCLLGSTVMGVQETKAKLALDPQLQNSELQHKGHIQERQDLQSKLTPYGQTLQLRNVQFSSDELILAINGNPKLTTSRLVNPDRIIVDLQATEVTPNIHNTIVPVNRYGVRQVRVAQFQNFPAIARLVFDLDNANPVRWQSYFDSELGLLLMRPSGVGALVNNPAASSPISSLPLASLPVTSSSLPTTIDSMSFNGYGQLVIQASQPIAYRSSLDTRNNTYSVTVPAARISAQLRRTILGANSPIEQIYLNQLGDAIVISIKTIAGWQIRETAKTNPKAITLQLASVRQVNPSVPSNKGSQRQQIYGNSTGRQIVMIDPGHGGPDVGANRNGVYEKDITLAMSKELGKILQQMGYAVAYTRTKDIDLDLESRVQIAESARASVFVSVHVNSLESNVSQVNGVETYYAPGASLGKSLANLVHNQIIASTGANDRGVRSARFYVIRNTSMPAILVETGYITNTSESSRLVNSSYQEQMAAAIAKGVDQFLKSYRR